MNRRRLEAEAIRDSPLATAGELDTSQGGPTFTELSNLRRTLYQHSARMGANTSDLGRLIGRYAGHLFGGWHNSPANRSPRKVSVPAISPPR